MQVICYDCYGTGEIGVTKDNRVIACETCGGQEDKLGTGRVDVVCAACAEKDAEIARLGAALKAALDALKAAPEPCWYDSQTPGVNKYRKWYNGWRQRALGLAEGEDDDDIGCEGCGNQGSMSIFGDNPGDGNDLCRACGNLELQAALGLGEEKITPEPDRDLEESEGNTWDDDPGWC